MQSEPIKIDLKRTLRQKLGKKSRFVPLFLVKWLERTVCAEELNKLLADNFPKTGAAFCKGVLNDLNVTVEVEGQSNLPSPENRRVIVVSNHPLGGLDGMALIDYFTTYFGCKVKFVVNDILMAVQPLEDVFVPINKHGSQSREAKYELDKVFDGDDPVIIFPAGLVSRMGKNGDVRDLEWKKMFVNKAINSRRDIIPVHFIGKNSDFFYKFARQRKKLGIKFNIEMIYLPREVFRAEGATFKIVCGKVIPWQTLKGGKDSLTTAEAIKDIVYGL